MTPRSYLAICVLGAIANIAPLGAQRPGDTIFVVPGSHLDLGFTAPISVVRQQRITILDHAIAAAESDPRFVWFEEGGWVVDAWLDRYHRDPSRIARLRALVVGGRIGIGATMLSPHGAAFPMILPLLTLHLDRIQRELGRRPVVAAVNDLPATPEALVDALARAGIHDLMMGPNVNFSPPIPTALARDAFFWRSSSGAQVLVTIDAHGYTDGLARWLLPPACLRLFDPRHFPASVSDDSILTLGVSTQLALRVSSQRLSLVQHAYDNGDVACAAALPDAIDRWNRRPGVARLILATPDVYFRHLLTAPRIRVDVHVGEWGGDWDLLRASEPVWSWRLRRAISSIASGTSRSAQIAAVMATDHNVGLGPRWQDGTPEPLARQHIAEVASLYRDVVRRGSGPAALTSLPAALPAPAAVPWPAAWARITGERASVARVRAGVGFIYPFVPPDAPALPTPVSVSADGSRMVIRAAIDRVALEHAIGPRYQAVIDVTLRAPHAALTIAPITSPSARAGRWLLGTPAQRVVASDGVLITGPGWTIEASGPLLLGWTLVPDQRDPAITHLQALAVVHAVEGVVANGARLRLPFAEAYPGEPAVPRFDLELRRQPR